MAKSSKNKAAAVVNDQNLSLAETIKAVTSALQSGATNVEAFRNGDGKTFSVHSATH